MSIALADVLKATAGQMLPALAGGLKKAQANAAERKIAESVLLNDRLYPDMFALVKQVQTATDMLARGTARLAGVAFLSLPDTEASFDELIARVHKVNDFIQAADAAAINASTDKVLTIPMGPVSREFTGQAYLLSFLLPNYFFHSTMTYAILRHNGVPLGKMDFLTAS